MYQGNNQAEQNTVRTFKQGELWPDVWASCVSISSIHLHPSINWLNLVLPPVIAWDSCLPTSRRSSSSSAGAKLPKPLATSPGTDLPWRRNHNFIVNKLFSINERGKFKPLDQLDEAGIKQQDEVLFQTARLINCGFFVNVVFYVRFLFLLPW